MTNTRSGTNTNDIDRMIEARGRQLHEMIASENWDGVLHLLQRNENPCQRLSGDHHHNNKHKTEKDNNTNDQMDIRKDIVLFKNNRNGHNALLCAYEYKASKEVLLKLIEIGGRDIILDQDTYGMNALQYACIYRSSEEVLLKLIEVGGREIIHEKNRDGRNALHWACMYRASIEVVSKLIEVGGREIVREKNDDGDNVIHCSYYLLIHFEVLSRDVFDLLVQKGGKDMLVEKNKRGMTPIQELFHLYPYDPSDQVTTKFIENAFVLLNKCIELQAGGEFAFGGIFSADEDVQQDMYGNKWNTLSIPILQQVMGRPQNHHQPIIQSAIINKAPPHIIEDIVSHFTDSINSVDSLGRCPIDVAVEQKLSWSDGIKEIVETFASAQQSTALMVGAKHGLSWENGMKCMVEDVDIDELERKDEETSLYLFMLAANGGEKYNYDLGAVFHLIQACPGCLIINAQ